MKKIIKILPYLLLLGSITLFLIPKYRSMTLKNEEKKIQKEYQRNLIKLEEVSSSKSFLDYYRKYFKNEDIIGRLKIEGVLDTLIVQGKDNDYYLNHLINKEENKLGSVFLDYRNNKESDKLLIYGHNSKTLTPEFHVLEKYLEETYYKTHRKIELQLEEEKKEYEIISVLITTTANHLTLNKYKFLEWVKKESLYSNLTGNEMTRKLLVLQTCYYEPDNSYLLIIGKEKK